MKPHHKQAAVLLGILLAVILMLCLLKTQIAEADKNEEESTCSVQIVYTEDIASETTTARAQYPSDPLAPYYELTMDEREWIATLVAGKAVDRTQTCQQAIATAILNGILSCHEDIGQAVRMQKLYDQKTPTDATYAAVDAVFERGEVLLDDDVLWFNDVGHASDFHDSLVYVCEFDGIAFYKAHSTTSEAGGISE